MNKYIIILPFLLFFSNNADCQNMAVTIDLREIIEEDGRMIYHYNNELFGLSTGVDSISNKECFSIFKLDINGRLIWQRKLNNYMPAFDKSLIIKNDTIIVIGHSREEQLIFINKFSLTNQEFSLDSVQSTISNTFSIFSEGILNHNNQLFIYGFLITNENKVRSYVKKLVNGENNIEESDILDSNHDFSYISELISTDEGIYAIGRFNSQDSELYRSLVSIHENNLDYIWLSQEGSFIEEVSDNLVGFETNCIVLDVEDDFFNSYPNKIRNINKEGIVNWTYDLPSIFTATELEDYRINQLFNLNDEYTICVGSYSYYDSDIEDWLNSGYLINVNNAGIEKWERRYFSPSLNDLYHKSIYFNNITSFDDQLIIIGTVENLNTKTKRTLILAVNSETGCTDHMDVQCNEIDSFLLSTKLLEQKANISVFPNPTSNIVTIESDIQFENMILTNSLGAKIKIDFNLNIDNRVSIDVSSLNSGVYFLQFQTLYNETLISFRKTLIVL